MGVVEGGPFHQKKFCPQNDVWVHFDTAFNWQKTWTVTGSFGTRILQFSRETKTV